MKGKGKNGENNRREEGGEGRRDGGEGAESEATMGECGDVAWDKADGRRSSGRRRAPRHLTSKGPAVGDEP